MSDSSLKSWVNKGKGKRSDGQMDGQMEGGEEGRKGETEGGREGRRCQVEGAKGGWKSAWAMGSASVSPQLPLTQGSGVNSVLGR